MWVDLLIRTKWLGWLSTPGLTEGTTGGWRCHHSSSTRSGCQDFFDYPILFSAIDFVMGSTGLWSFWLVKKNGAPSYHFVLVCDALEEPWTTGRRPPLWTSICSWRFVLSPFLSVGIRPPATLGFGLIHSQTRLNFMIWKAPLSIRSAFSLWRVWTSHEPNAAFTVSIADLCLFILQFYWLWRHTVIQYCSKCIL